MTSNIPTTTVRIEPRIKEEASVILNELGLSMSSSINLFLRAVIREGGMPFELKVSSNKAIKNDNLAERERERERESK